MIQQYVIPSDIITPKSSRTGQRFLSEKQHTCCRRRQPYAFLFYLTLSKENGAVWVKGREPFARVPNEAPTETPVMIGLVYINTYSRLIIQWFTKPQLFSTRYTSAAILLSPLTQRRTVSMAKTVTRKHNFVVNASITSYVSVWHLKMLKRVIHPSSAGKSRLFYKGPSLNTMEDPLTFTATMKLNIGLVEEKNLCTGRSFHSTQNLCIFKCGVFWFYWPQ